MINRTNKRIRRALLPTLIVSILAGCGSDKAEKNLEPTISGTPQQVIAEGQPYYFAPNLYDYELDQLTVSSSVGLPKWLSLNSQTGVLSGTPSYEDAGKVENIVLTVSDGQNSSELTAFDLTVLNTNRKPVNNFGLEQNRAVIIGSVFEFNLGFDNDTIATDPDGQELTYVAYGLPDWAYFDGKNGSITSYDRASYDDENIKAEDVVNSVKLNETFSVSIYAVDDQGASILAQQLNLMAYKEVQAKGILITNKPEANATIYQDTNSNNRWDYREPKTKTDIHGQFTLDITGKDAMEFHRSLIRAEVTEGTIGRKGAATFEEANVTFYSMPLIDESIVDGVFSQPVIISPYTDYLARELEADLYSYFRGGYTAAGIQEKISVGLDSFVEDLDEVYAYEHKGSESLDVIKQTIMANYLSSGGLSLTEEEFYLLSNEAEYLTMLRQAETDSRDTDGDGELNFEEADDDGDGIKDDKDDLPLDPTDSVDTDRDGIGNLTDPDDDNDGVLDEDDDYPLNPKRIANDSDDDGYGDDDEIDNGSDPFDKESIPANDYDGDFVSDLNDTDDDNDGILDVDDAFPYDKNEWADLDGDGIGDNADNDVDNDGVIDIKDHFPENKEAYTTFMFNAGAQPDKYSACFSDYTDGDAPVLSCIDKEGNLTQGMTYNFLAETDIAYGYDAKISYNFFAGECLLENGEIKCYSGDLYSNGGDFYDTDGKVTGEWGTRTPELSVAYQVNVHSARLCYADLSGVKCLGSKEILDNYGRLDMQNVKRLGSGEQHTCALTSDEVRCRGLDTAPYNLSELPERISFTNPIDMFTNTAKTCVLDDKGLQCWGDPTEFSYCVDIDGSQNEHQLQCWGDENFFDQDGYIYEEGYERPVKTIAMEDVTAVDMSFSGGCLANQAKGLSCFGNGFDAPTSNVTLDNPEPVFLTVPSLTNVTDVAHSNLDICALSDEGITCFGKLGTIMPELGEVYDLNSSPSALCVLAENGTYCITDAYTGFIEDLVEDEVVEQP